MGFVGKMEFSAAIYHLAGEEEGWLKEQLGYGVVSPDNPASAKEGPAEFDFVFADDPDRPGRLLAFFTHEDVGGDPFQVARLVQRFLRRWRPAQCWAITFSLKRIGCLPDLTDVSGGGIFVTKDELSWQLTAEFTVGCLQKFYQQTGQPVPEPEEIL